MAAAAKAPAFKDSPSSPTKQQEIEELLHKLHADLTEYNLLPFQRTSSLEQLKVFSRDVKDTDTLYTREAIETIAKQSFYSPSTTTSREGLRCLANIFLLAPPTRQFFVDMGFAGRAAERLKVDNRDDEFLISRMLFLFTYDTDLNFEPLIKDHDLGESINQNIARHAKRKPPGEGGRPKAIRKMSLPDPMNEMALAESLKLMFNINHFYPQHSEVFLKSIAPILKMLQSTRIPTPPLQQPINYLINALTNVDFLNKKCFQSGASPMFPKADPKCNAEQLINIFDKAITDYKEAELDTAVAPVLTLIRKIYECAPETVKEYIESRLLPSDEDRDVPLGRSETLPSKLLRLSTSPMLPTLRTSISAMMFELSGSDAKKFVNNVGYGFAAGFLMSQNMSIPANAAEAFSDGSRRPSVSGDSSEGAAGINPVTGQRLDAESRHEGPEMTQEEKEREAERLFVLFERLRANGVLSAENPVRTAVESGRFEELPDDAPD